MGLPRQLGGRADDDTRYPSKLWKKVVILAECVVNAGLTQDARFPMMANQPNLLTRRGEAIQIQEILIGFSPCLGASVMNGILLCA
jgi:hypothetical protein